MNKLQNIILKYTGVTIGNANYIFDNTLDLIEDSVLVLNMPSSSPSHEYVTALQQHLLNVKVIATIFINGCEILFSDKDNFGTCIITNEMIVNKIINEKIVWFAFN